MVWPVRKVRPHIHVGHPHRPIFCISRNHAPAAPVEDDPVVNPQEAREGVGHFREAVLRDITAGWLAFGKRYRRGAEGNTSAQGDDDSGGAANHNLTPFSFFRTWGDPKAAHGAIKMYHNGVLGPDCPL